jgi:hypothetical protein
VICQSGQFKHVTEDQLGWADSDLTGPNRQWHSPQGQQGTSSWRTGSFQHIRLPAFRVHRPRRANPADTMVGSRTTRAGRGRCEPEVKRWTEEERDWWLTGPTGNKVENGHGGHVPLSWDPAAGVIVVMSRRQSAWASGSDGWSLHTYGLNNRLANILRKDSFIQIHWW